MVSTRIKQMMFVFLIVIVIAVFSGCVWNCYSEKQIKNIASDKLSKVNIGMTVEQVHSVIGEPEIIYTEKNTEHYRTWMKSIQNKTIKIYPENLIDNLPDKIFEHVYRYTIELNNGAGFALYFNDKDELIGWDCKKSILPDDWDEICAKQEKLRLSTQSH